MAATFPKASAAVEAARQRRVGQADKSSVRIEWFIKEVSSKVTMTMDRRVRMATEYLKSKVVKNISRPVTKGGRRVTGRSVAGEFPKAETTELMKTIMSGVIRRGGRIDGWVGTPLSYGVILELRMNRSFLVRTLREQGGMIRRILTGPIR